MELYGYIAEHDDTLLAARLDGVWMPLIVAKKELALRMQPLAQQIADGSRKQVALVRFENAEVLGRIVPSSDA